ncbi:MAG: hypothetical protein ACYSXF_04065 [Planctomycetota bacterium]
MSELETPEASQRRQLAAMAVMDTAPPDPAYIEALHRIIWRPGYTVTVREAALNRLIAADPEGLQRTIRQHLPRLTAWAWLTRLCEIIVEQQWIEQTPALVSSWARPSISVRNEKDRPEHRALAQLHGAEPIPEVVFEVFVESTKVYQQGLRTRCWELLHRLGDRERLVRWLAESEARDDVLLIDLRAAATDLGIVPYTREEILWLRKQRDPERAAFWSEAMSAVAALEPARRAHLELRDVPVVVSARLHAPWILDLSKAELFGRVEAYVSKQKHHSHGSNYNNFASGRPQGLFGWRNKLTWGDLLAMLIAIQALEVPQVVDHLFDYAERDRLDESTEYGGVIRLDEKGRYEILEFPPRLRFHDRKFVASQEMLDAAYTSLFHFHLHVQKYRNADFAGPGYGDVNYADNTRANCLVFTFVNERTMNVDFYRHGNVVVDLGEIRLRAP